MEKKDIEAQIATGDRERVAKLDKADSAFDRARTAQNEARISLAEFRWTWVGNADNPDKVSQKEYAAAAGISIQQVSVSVRAWGYYLEDTTRPLGEALVRATMAPLRWEATLRVASQRHVTPGTAAKNYKNEIAATEKALKARQEADKEAATIAAQTKAEARVSAAQVVPIGSAKSATEAKAVKADAAKVAAKSSKAALASVPAPAQEPAAGQVVEATWEALTDAKVDEMLANVTDRLHKLENEIRDLVWAKIPADMMIERSKILSGLVERTGIMGQELNNLIIAAKVDIDLATKDTAKTKKAQ